MELPGSDTIAAVGVLSTIVALIVVIVSFLDPSELPPSLVVEALVGFGTLALALAAFLTLAYEREKRQGDRMDRARDHAPHLQVRAETEPRASDYRAQVPKAGPITERTGKRLVLENIGPGVATHLSGRFTLSVFPPGLKEELAKQDPEWDFKTDPVREYDESPLRFPVPYLPPSTEKGVSLVSTPDRWASSDVDLREVVVEVSCEAIDGYPKNTAVGGFRRRWLGNGPTAGDKESNKDSAEELWEEMSEEDCRQVIKAQELRLTGRIPK